MSLINSARIGNPQKDYQSEFSHWNLFVLRKREMKAQRFNAYSAWKKYPLCALKQCAMTKKKKLHEKEWQSEWKKKRSKKTLKIGFYKKQIRNRIFQNLRGSSQELKLNRWPDLGFAVNLLLTTIDRILFFLNQIEPHFNCRLAITCWKNIFKQIPREFWNRAPECSLRHKNV